MAPGDDASSLDQQLKHGGSRSAPQLLSVESPLLSVGREHASGMEEGPGRPLSALVPSQGPQEGLGAPPRSARSSCPMADLAFFSVLTGAWDRVVCEQMTKTGL